MQRYEASQGLVVADKVIAYRGCDAAAWNLVTASGDIVRMSHNDVAKTGVKVGDYLIYSPDHRLLGSIKAAVFEAVFKLRVRAAA